MAALIDVILPVFLVIGFGYVAVWRGMFAGEWVDGLMKLAQNFAIPCLLFNAIATLELNQDFDLRLLFSFYTGASAGFILGIFGARVLFRRPWEDSVAIGFCCLFSNSLLLGLPITERAYGSGALAANYAIIALHSPFCYLLGIGTMEVIKNKGSDQKNGFAMTLARILRSLFSNPLVIGICLGFVVNIASIPVPGVMSDALDLMIRAALPAALFGLGGVLYQYQPEGDLKAIAFVVVISLVMHPLIVWGMGKVTGLSTTQFRSAILTAAMAPGINSYIFANMYRVAKRVAASSVLIGTAFSIITIWTWLALLP